MKYFTSFLFFFLLITATYPANSQSIYDEGEGSYLAFERIQITSSGFVNLPSSENLSLVYSNRLDDNLDIGVLFAYRYDNENPNNSEPFAGYNITFGPHVGYTQYINSGTGIRAEFQGHVSFSDYSLAGNADFGFAGGGIKTVFNLFQRFDIGSIALFPQIGIYSNLTGFSDQRLNGYGYNTHVQNSTDISNSEELQNWHYNTGITLGFPVSVLRDRSFSVSLEPAYRLNSANNETHSASRFELKLRFGF